MHKFWVGALSMWVLCACQAEPEYSTSGGGGVVGSGAGGNVLPPLMGSSVAALSDGRAVVADPESDSVFAVRDAAKVKVQFAPGSFPTRIAVADKELGVVLRGSGKLALVRTSSGGFTATSETEVCMRPRSVAHQPSQGAYWVACEGGDLVRVQDGQVQRLQTGLELADVLLVSDQVWVTTFRDAKLLRLGPQGEVLAELTPPSHAQAQVTFVPKVAWRTVVDGNRLVMVHQLHVVDEVTRLTNPGPSQPYYGKPLCEASVVTSAVTVFDAAEQRVVSSNPLVGVLPVDVAVEGNHLAVAFAGTGEVHEYDLGFAGAPCLIPSVTQPEPLAVGVGYVERALVSVGHPGALRRAGALEPLKLVPPRQLDEGRALFHTQSPSGVACASCHPEGRDDGHTWQFGARHVRSQSLEGGLLSTAPFHWDGRLAGISDVLSETFVTRMGGRRPDSSTAQAVGAWLDGLPTRPSGATPAPEAVQRGREVFAQAQCESCHAGAHFTNGATVDVGSGGPFQVPSLKGLKWRGPWMHDGCAKTLEQRFDGPCGGTAHGTVAAQDVPHLIAFLNTL